MTTRISQYGTTPGKQFLRLPGLGSGANLQPGEKLRWGDDAEVAEYFRTQIDAFIHLRRRREKSWQRSEAAYQNSQSVSSELEDGRGLFEVFDELKIGLPYAATATTVAALTPNKPDFRVSPKTPEATDFAALCQVLLNSTWASDERQFQIEKWVRSARHKGLMIGRVVYETDYREHEKRQEKEAEEEAARAGFAPDVAQMDRMISKILDEEIRGETAGKAPPRLRPIVDHATRMDEVGVEVVNPWDYVADIHSEDLVYGPRWEGRKIRVLYKDVLENPRYNRSVAKMIRPQMRQRFDKRNFYDRLRPDSTLESAAPVSHQLVELHEIFWYDDPKFKDSFGSMLTISIHEQGIGVLERRANPYRCRPFAVDEWSGDVGEVFPQPDMDSWADVWDAYEETLHRGVTQIRRAPYSTLMVDKGVVGTPDDLEAVLENDNGGVAFVDTQGNTGIQGAFHELSTRQVSPEFINFARYLIEVIRLAEGLGPNQFGGAPLRSETSATEAGEIGRFSRARLDVKQNALHRFLTKLARGWLSTTFLFKSAGEISKMAGKALTEKGIDPSKMTTDLAMMAQVDVTITPGSMGPNAQSQKVQKLQLALQVLTQVPFLQQQIDPDAILNLLTDLTRLETGQPLFVGADDPMAQLNILRQKMAGGTGGSAPSAQGKSNNPEEM